MLTDFSLSSVHKSHDSEGKPIELSHDTYNLEKTHSNAIVSNTHSINYVQISFNRHAILLICITRIQKHETAFVYCARVRVQNMTPVVGGCVYVTFVVVPHLFPCFFPSQNFFDDNACGRQISFSFVSLFHWYKCLFLRSLQPSSQKNFVIKYEYLNN